MVSSLILLQVSPSRASTHISSAVAFARDLYSASVLDLDTVAYFLALQETKFGPTNIAKNPVTFYHQESLPNLHLKKH
jgi:hypothetical protein